MHILLLGKSGQVGWELQRSLAPLGKITALDSRSTNWCGDLQQPAALSLTIQQLHPDVIVNASAYTAVDLAETERDRAELINTKCVAIIAQEAKKIGALFVHYSTDYVYSGSGESHWFETDLTDPVNIYGITKRAGEKAIEQENGEYLIFRTSWVYASRGNNFIRTMLRLASERKTLKIIDDQIGAPTSAALIADVTAHAILLATENKSVCGIYNLAAAGETSWFEYANLVFNVAKEMGNNLIVEEVQPINSYEYPTQARRPLNSRLNLDKIERAFRLKMPAWEENVTFTVKELLSD